MASAPIFDSPGRVQKTIAAARKFAEQKDIPLTLERLAVSLGVSSRDILALAMGGDEPAEPRRRVQALLRAACEEVAAGLVEHGMAHNATMDVLMLKYHFRYTDKGDAPAAGAAPVVICGEDALPE